LKRTVFVLGAGASDPFGFPIGRQLYKRVVETLLEQNGGFLALRQLGFASDEIESFRIQLSHSGRQSVDAFLEHRPELRRIGKAAMAYILVGRESPERLFADEGDWLGYLYNRIPNPLRELVSETVSFLTFNYDRSLEHFLFSALSNGFGADEETCIEALKKIPIVHLHGSLGRLPWQAKDLFRPYEAIPDAHALEIASTGIKIVHDDITDGRDADFALAKDLLERAKQVYFLGFGYDRTNMQRLGIAQLEERKCYGTGLGLTGRELTDIGASIKNRIGIGTGIDCLGFVRNEVNWT
jgi:hypothetical protein